VPSNEAADGNAKCAALEKAGGATGGGTGADPGPPEEVVGERKDRSTHKALGGMAKQENLALVRMPFETKIIDYDTNEINAHRAYWAFRSICGVLLLGLAHIYGLVLPLFENQPHFCTGAGSGVGTRVLASPDRSACIAITILVRLQEVNRTLID
jgi:hypothetical protein